MTETEERELWEMVYAAFGAKGKPEFEQRIRAIEERWMPAYEFWLVGIRDRARGGKTT